MRNAGHLHFDGNGYLLLDFLGGAAWPLCDDLNIVVGDIGVGFHREILERNGTPSQEDDANDQDQQFVS